MSALDDLSARLAAIDAEVLARAPDYVALVEAFVQRLRLAETGATAPAVGEALPGFVLPALGGRFVSLAEALRSGPVVVAFLRGQWCDYCDATAAALRDLAPEVAALGGRIIVITPELSRFSASLAAGSAITLTFDMDNGYALSLNLAVHVDEAVAQGLKAFDIDVPQRNGALGWTLPIPATFVLSRDGIIRARFVDADYRRRMRPAAILEALTRSP